MMLDLYSRKVIGWAMSDRNDTQLVCDALMMAYWQQGKPKKRLYIQAKAVHMHLISIVGY
jgi:putative transposase